MYTRREYPYNQLQIKTSMLFKKLWMDIADENIFLTFKPIVTKSSHAPVQG